MNDSTLSPAASGSRHRLLIVNRGEIAVRIIRACRDMGLTAIALYADGDQEALHVQLADEAWALEGRSPADTYLHTEKVLQAARLSQATMIHPGYGFLSERSDFAEAVLEAGLIWVGPSPDTIRLLGDKLQARQLAARVGAPLAQGTDRPVQSVSEVHAFVAENGLPVAIKAAYGGGGRGIKVIREPTQIDELFKAAQRESKAAFGRDECFIEQFLSRPRHIEVQIVADQHGQVAVAGTRDCSLQRRNQKLVEEAPAPFLNESLRCRAEQAAIDICRAAQYAGVGTVEFLLSEAGQLSFLEVNTRLQVEHPVTEETSRQDLVVEQIRIAMGLPLSSEWEKPAIGHAIEFRINAEDPAKSFLPSAGQITSLRLPAGPGVRVDAGVCEGAVIDASFDSLTAKVIVVGRSRAQALARARRALAEFRIDGVATVLPFHQAVLNHPDFTEHFSVHTRWIEEDFDGSIDIQPKNIPAESGEIQRFYIEIDGRRCQVGLPPRLLQRFSRPLSDVDQRAVAHVAEPDEQMLLAPAAGTLLEWKSPDDSFIEAGQWIATMEAMKMEIQVHAHRSGHLRRQAQAGQAVTAHTVLALIVAEESR